MTLRAGDADFLYPTVGVTGECRPENPLFGESEQKLTHTFITSRETHGTTGFKDTVYSTNNIYLPNRIEVKATSGKGFFLFTNFRSGPPACRQVTLLENCMYRRNGGEYNMQRLD